MVVPRFIVLGVPTGVSNFSLSSLLLRELLRDNPLLFFVVALLDDVANRFGAFGATTLSFESSPLEAKKRKDDSSSVAEEYSEDDDEKEPSELSETLSSSISSSSVESDCCLRFLRPPLFLVLLLLL
jgi:hypothetical protein